MTANRWMIAGAVALVAAFAAFFLIRSDGSEAADGSTPVDLPPGLEREALETVIREYILANPEIIPEAMERLQMRQASEMVEDVRAELETPFAGAWAGSEDADVTVVQFFDYACPYSRTSFADLERLLAEDDDIRVVFRELPILSPESEEAARVSLSAARQQDYMAFHRAMYEAGRPNAATIAQAQRVAGLDSAQVSRDRNDDAIDEELIGNLELARRLGLTGTPAFIVGDQVMSGAVGYERLKQAIEEARQARGA